MKMKLKIRKSIHQEGKALAVRRPIIKAMVLSKEI